MYQISRLVYLLFVLLTATAVACDPGGRWQPVWEIGGEVEGERVKFSRGGIIVTPLEGDWFTGSADLRIHVANQGMDKARLELKDIEFLVFEPTGDMRTGLNVVSITIGDQSFKGPASRYYKEQIAEHGGEEEYLNSPHLYINVSESMELLLWFHLVPGQVQDSSFDSVRSATLRLPLTIQGEHAVVFEIPFENKDFRRFWFR